MNDRLFEDTRYDPGLPERRAVTVGAVGSSNPIELANLGISWRDEGVFDRAEQIFRDLIERFPDLVYGWQELGVLCRKMGREEDALALFRHACMVDPGDFLSRRYYATQLLRLGHGDDAKSAIVHPPWTDPDTQSAAMIFSQLIDFVIDHPQTSMNGLVQLFEQDERFLNAHSVAAQIQTALDEARPFSLIRLGDGEGAWLSVNDHDEARFAGLYEANRREILRVWFGSDDLYNDPAFIELAGQFVRILEHTSIIGLPYGDRMNNEYGVFSIRGIPSIANIFRALTVETAPNLMVHYCENDVHLKLHLEGHLQTLLKGTYKIGVISCHADLGWRLMEHYGARVVSQIIVPEEKSFQQVKGISGMSLPHYPIPFYRTIERLRRSAGEAQLWLVAAGFLGKFYCDAIRGAGSVALDIGSVADGWCGRVTRPTLSQIGRYTLGSPA